MGNHRLCAARLDESNTSDAQLFAEASCSTTTSAVAVFSTARRKRNHEVSGTRRAIWGGMSPRSIHGQLARITTTNSYNKRLQPVILSASPPPPSATVFSLSYDFHLGTADNGNVFYLQCTHTEKNGDTCQQQQVGTDENGKAQMVWVQGITKDGQFTATQIGNDENGNLVDKTTGTGAYASTIDQSGVYFARDGSTTSSGGVFVNGTDPTTIRGSGDFQGFTFTFYNSKLEAGQTAAGLFTFQGTPEQAGAALKAAGFTQRNSSYFEPGYDVYRSRGSSITGANSAHFNVQQIILNSRNTPPQTPGNMHFGEHNPFSPLGWASHCLGDKARF